MGGGERCDLSLLRESFVDDTTECYDLDTTRIPSNLTRIRDFQNGDILVVPHLPENGKVSLVVVNGDFPECYRYVPDDVDHLNHRIRVSEHFGLNGQISVDNARLARWKSKLQWRRYPVLRIEEHEKEFQNVISLLREDPDHTLEPSELDELLDRMREDVLELVDSAVRERVAPTGSGLSFEGLCRRVLETHGYRIVGSHEYDRKGGDVDFRCVREETAIGPFESGERPLLVQVKKHEGSTGRKAVEQLLPALEREDADGCVVSLASQFTEDARELAEQNGVLLLDGEALVELVLAELVE